VLKEIRGCLEAELLVDVQQRLVLLSRDVENQNGHRLLINRLSQAVDQIEKRRQQNRPWKVVHVRCGFHEDQDAARDRHFAAHPEDQDADVVIVWPE
jgi:hypothetical protein